ncbi:sigma factor [Blautia sp. HA2174]
MSADIEEQYDKIYRYCYFKTQNAALAEDLTQECFLKYISQNTYVERGKELAYLYTIA